MQPHHYAGLPIQIICNGDIAFLPNPSKPLKLLNHSIFFKFFGIRKVNNLSNIVNFMTVCLIFSCLGLAAPLRQDESLSYLIRSVFVEQPLALASSAKNISE